MKVEPIGIALFATRDLWDRSTPDEPFAGMDAEVIATVVAQELQHQGWHAPGSCSSAEDAACKHEESLYGRCVACGMTWEQQAAQAEASMPPTDALRRHPNAKLWECRHCDRWYSDAGPGPEPMCPYCALITCVEPVRDLLRNLSPDQGCGYPTYKDVWDEGRVALTIIERLARAPISENDGNRTVKANVADTTAEEADRG